MYYCHLFSIHKTIAKFWVRKLYDLDIECVIIVNAITQVNIGELSQWKFHHVYACIRDEKGKHQHKSELTSIRDRRKQREKGKSFSLIFPSHSPSRSSRWEGKNPLSASAVVMLVLYVFWVCLSCSIFMGIYIM